jgi:hypothetical protein
MRKATQRGALVVAVIGALVIGGWWWSAADKPAGQKAQVVAPTATPPVAGNAPPDEAVAEEGPSQEASAAVAPVLDKTIHDPLEQVRDALQRYREFAVYPPWSRPFADNTAPYVDWNKLKPEGQPFAVDESGRELMVELGLDRMFAGPGEPIRATIKCGRMEGGSLQPAAFDLVEARVERNDPGKGLVVVQRLVLNQSGPVYSTQFVPSETKVLAERAQEVMVTVEVKKGVFFKTIRMPFQYAAVSPMRVLGIRGDAIEDGSLVVDLEVDVARVAPTLVQAVLYDRAGRTPIAIYDDYFRPTALGKQHATIAFFGRALKEKNVNGPYSIRALHGVSKDLEGADQYWKHDDDPVLLTKAYAATSFSGAEWESAEKRAKIAQYEEILRAGALP